MPRRVMIAMTIMLPLFRNRIVTSAAPGVTTGDAFQTKPTSMAGTVNAYRLKKILGTGRGVAAPAARAADGMNHRGEKFLIAADDQTNQALHRATSGLKPWRRIPARLAERLQSSCNSRRDASPARHRAIVTIQ